MRDHDEPITVCKLYEKTSKHGNTYFQGRWGNAKVLLFKTKDVSDSDGSPIWELKLAQAAPYEKKEQPASVPPPALEHDDGIDIENEGPARPFDDGDIPF
jgi:hypothetical protein